MKSLMTKKKNCCKITKTTTLTKHSDLRGDKLTTICKAGTLSANCSEVYSKNILMQISKHSSTNGLLVVAWYGVSSATSAQKLLCRLSKVFVNNFNWNALAEKICWISESCHCPSVSSVSTLKLKMSATRIPLLCLTSSRDLSTART